MKLNKYTNINLNTDLKLNKKVLISGAAIATVTTVAIVCNKVAKKKAKKAHKDEELACLVDDLENISTKIVELSQNQKQLDILIKEKAVLKDNFTFKPY